jgi:hypothetical protein
LKPFLHRRILALKAQYETFQEEVKQKRKSRTDLNALDYLYKMARSKYEELTPEKLRLKYFENKAAFDYDSAFLSRKKSSNLSELQPVKLYTFILWKWV